MYVYVLDLDPAHLVVLFCFFFFLKLHLLPHGYCSISISKMLNGQIVSIEYLT